MNVEISKLNPHPDNVKIYGEEDVHTLADEIRLSGWIKPVVINQDNVIISGHRRTRAAQLLGYVDIPTERITTRDEWHLLEMLLLENKFRDKTAYQKVKEAEQWERIESEKARERQISLAGFRPNTGGDLVENFPQGEQGKTRDKVAEQVGFGSGRTYETAKKVVAKVDELKSEGKQKEATILQAALNQSVSGALKLANSDLSSVQQNTIDKLKNDEITPSEILKKINGPHVSNNSGENEWYTPLKIIEAAKTVLGGIDLDPASSETANEIVKARTIFTIETDGLTKNWFGKVWINPPYSQPEISSFSEKIVSEVINYESCIVLVNNATETKWFQNIASIASAFCFPVGRIKFWNPEKTTAAPLQGQTIIYIGKEVKLFKNEFSPFGLILEK